MFRQLTTEQAERFRQLSSTVTAQSNVMRLIVRNDV